MSVCVCLYVGIFVQFEISINRGLTGAHTEWAHQITAFGTSMSVGSAIVFIYTIIISIWFGLKQRDSEILHFFFSRRLLYITDYTYFKWKCPCIFAISASAHALILITTPCATKSSLSWICSYKCSPDWKSMIVWMRVWEIKCVRICNACMPMWTNHVLKHCKLN